MRILFHALGATMGGAQRHLSSFVPALSGMKVGNSYHVLVRGSLDISVGGNIRLHRVPDTYATVGPARLWFDSVEVPRIVRQLGIDAVVSLMNIGPIRVNVPHIIFQRNALLFSPEHMALFGRRQVAKFRIQRFLALAAMKRAQRIVTPSESMATLIKENCPNLPRDRFFVLPHAFNPGAYVGDLDVRKKQLLDRPGAKALYPSLAGPHKGFSIISKIAKELPESLPMTIYITGGDEGGELIADLRRQAQSEGVANRLIFLGRVPQDQMGALYRACDLLLYVSPIESFGFALLEALAFRLPIVALDSPTNRELCRTAAKYFPAGDAMAASAMIQAALRPATYNQLKRSAEQEFGSRDRTWDAYASTLLGLVEEVI